MDFLKNLEGFKHYNEKVNKFGYDYVTMLDEYYPHNLRYIEDRPALLFYKGNLDYEKDRNSIAFVGARKCTDYGKWACKNLTQGIANSGITTVSGLAYGIDAMCHKSTLEVSGRTIGVIGCGIDKIYPKQNRNLYEQLEERGLILSEFPLGTDPRSFNFPRRNRIISGISLATVVIEAKEKSGTMITTRCALDQGKEVFAIPGNINSIYSKGTNKLIQEGSKLITCADDILEELWKSNPNFSKKDAVVSLILFSTAMYHYRRCNKLGALKSFKKALYTFKHAKDKETLGLKVNEFTFLIQNQIEKVKYDQTFQPIQLPIKSSVEREIINLYPNYEYKTQINN
ncbi:MAG: DNA-processing protein DprA, partial [Anaerococcus sp.]|uniref:DNA-processing protein DprA n=1 Tax=Anaerococcus sp. TaxID=1872515 RepID=UPI0028FEA29D